MLLLLLKSSACLAAFMLFYKLLLEREAMHQFKRFYLLGALIIAIIIPFITFIEYIEPAISYGEFDMNSMSTPPYFPADISVEEVDKTNYLPLVLWSIYALGVLLFGIKFGVNLFKMISKINKNEKQKQDRFITVLLQDLVSPHTFFSYIFLNKTKFETKAIPDEVLLHEETHAKQKHSLDVLFIELLQVVFWFNPLLYLIKKDIKLNHEFLADEAVLKQGTDSSTYQNTLLAFSSSATQPELANAINYSLIKKRFTIMKTKTSKQAVWLRSLLLLPLLGMLLFSFSSTEQVEKNAEPLMQIKTTEGATESMMKEYKAFMIAYETKKRIDISKHKRIVAIYRVMTEEQKALVKKYPEIPNIDLNNVQAKKPTKEQFESWKNKNMFAIWIDGKHIDNIELDKYSFSHFVHFTGSLVHINARSDKFSQPYQFQLYTEKGFKKTYRNPVDGKDVEFEKVVSEILTEKNKNLEAQKTSYNIPVLDIKQNPLMLRLNGKTTTLENLEKDFKTAITTEKSDLRINSQEGISMGIINDIQAKLKNHLDKIRLAENVHLIGIEDEKAVKENLVYNRKTNTKIALPTIGSSVCDDCTLTVNKAFIKQAKLSTTKDEEVTSFKIKFYNKPEIEITGDKLNKTALNYLEQTKNEEVLIFDIKTNDNNIASVIGLKIKENIKTTLTVNGIPCDGCSLNLSKKGVEQIILGTNTGDHILSFKMKVPGNKTTISKGDALSPASLKVANNLTIGTVVQLFDIKTTSKEKLKPVMITIVDKNDKNYSKSPIVVKGELSKLPPPPPPIPSAKEVTEYNAWAKKINSETNNITNNAKLLPIAEEKNLRKYINIYKRMTTEQKKHSEKMPFDGLELKSTESKLPPPPPPPAPPAPNTPSSFEKYIKNMERNGDVIYYENKKITVKQAVSIYKKFGKLDMLTQKAANGKYIVKLSQSTGKISKVVSEDISKNPPPPPPPVNPNASPKEKAKQKKYIEEYNREYKVVKGKVYKKLPPPPPLSPDATLEEKKRYKETMAKYKAMRIKEQKLKKREKAAKEVIKEKKREKEMAERKLKVRKGELSNIPPPPPPPKSPLDHVIDMAKKGAKFTYNGKDVTSDEAISLLKKNNKLNISSNTNNGVSTVHISTKGIKTVNGKLVKSKN